MGRTFLHEQAFTGKLEKFEKPIVVEPTHKIKIYILTKRWPFFFFFNAYSCPDNAHCHLDRIHYEMFPYDFIWKQDYLVATAFGVGDRRNLAPSTRNPKSSAGFSNRLKRRVLWRLSLTRTRNTHTRIRIWNLCWPAFYSVLFHIPTTFLRLKLFSVVSFLTVRQSIDHYFLWRLLYT